jgi:aspartyl-tRNA(Asn)/glutamyl-tRNA(Gln) amidotransferase subunit A
MPDAPAPRWAELIGTIGREWLGRDNWDTDLAAELAARAEGLMRRLRAVDEASLGETPLPYGMDPAGPALEEKPGALGLDGLNRIPGGTTGYGASRTGAPAVTSAKETMRRPGEPEVWADDAWASWSAAEVARAVTSGAATPEEMVEAALSRIAALDPALHAVVHLRAEAARQEARDVARLLRDEPGRVLPLAGVPVVVKDLYHVAGAPTTAGSATMAGVMATSDAWAVHRLKQAGAVIVAKVSTHEWAFGVTTDTPFHGPTHNPWRLDRSPGGSSGGSAAAVAARLVPLALGTDTGGSIRIPASLTGIVGLKPTTGLVGRSGILPLSWSLDHAGPLGRTVGDVALALDVLAAFDPADPGSVRRRPGHYAEAVARAEARGSLKGLRVGIPETWIERVSPEVNRAFRRAWEHLRDLGARVGLVPLPDAGTLTLVNRVITMCEAAAYHGPRLASAGDRFSPDVRERLELGSVLLARDYLLAQRLRTEAARVVAGAWQMCDVVVLPTTPMPAPRIGEASWEVGGVVEPVAETLVRWTAPFSVTGHPAVSVPMGFTSAGLPMGLQMVAPPFGESRLLAAAAVFSTTFPGGRGGAEGGDFRETGAL